MTASFSSMLGWEPKFKTRKSEKETKLTEVDWSGVCELRIQLSFKVLILTGIGLDSTLGVGL